MNNRPYLFFFLFILSSNILLVFMWYYKGVVNSPQSWASKIQPNVTSQTHSTICQPIISQMRKSTSHTYGPQIWVEYMDPMYKHELNPSSGWIRISIKCHSAYKKSAHGLNHQHWLGTSGITLPLMHNNTQQKNKKSIILFL